MTGFLNKMETCGTIKSIISPLQKSNSFGSPSMDQYQSNLGKERIWVPFAEGTCVILHAKMSRCALSCWVCSVTHPAPALWWPWHHNHQTRHVKLSSSPALFQNSEAQLQITALTARGVNSLLNHPLPSAEMTQAAGSAPGWGMWTTGSPLLCCTKSRSLHRWRLQHCLTVLKSRDKLPAESESRANSLKSL